MDEPPGLLAAPARLIQFVFPHWHWQHADAVLQQRLGLSEARAPANRALGLIAEMDGSRHLWELGANVVGVSLDFAAHADEELARLAASIIDDDLGAHVSSRTLAADDGRSHYGFVHAGGAAFGAGDKATLALLVIGAAVWKPALECMSFGAAERKFDHRSVCQKRIEFACRLERVQIIAAADVCVADENLRHRPAAIRLRRHRRLGAAVAVNADFLKRSRLVA